MQMIAHRFIPYFFRQSLVEVMAIVILVMLMKVVEAMVDGQNFHASANHPQITAGVETTRIYMTARAPVVSTRVTCGCARALPRNTHPARARVFVST